MRAVRFELTHLSIAELKSAALDHSAKLADIRNKVSLFILIFYVGRALQLLEEVHLRALANAVTWLAADKVPMMVA